MRLSRTRIVRVPILAALALVVAPTLAADEDFVGIVTKVFDGDSFLVRPEGDARAKDLDVRLQDIDAPEKDQPHADVARAELRRLVEGRRVFVDVITTDQYQRKIAKVYREPDRLELARALVHDGHAWVNRRYAKDRALIALEDRARSSSAGLWRLPASEQVPPWEFRKENSRKKAQKAQK